MQTPCVCSAADKPDRQLLPKSEQHMNSRRKAVVQTDHLETFQILLPTEIHGNGSDWLASTAICNGAFNDTHKNRASPLFNKLFYMLKFKYIIWTFRSEVSNWRAICRPNRPIWFKRWQKIWAPDGFVHTNPTCVCPHCHKWTLNGYTHYVSQPHDGQRSVLRCNEFCCSELHSVVN